MSWPGTGPRPLQPERWPNPFRKRQERVEPGLPPKTHRGTGEFHIAALLEPSRPPRPLRERPHEKRLH